MDQGSLKRDRIGIAFVLSAPSGAGKTTIAHKLAARMTDIHLSVSHTTRPPRGKEKDGREYHFVSSEQFARMEGEGAFLESALVHGNRYGTHQDEVLPFLASGTDVVLDIDVQGAAQVRGHIDSIGIFILPPGRDELIERLKLRNTDGDDVIKRRIENAAQEVARASSYDYLVINDNLEKAVGDVTAIITAERMRMARNKPIIDRFLGNHG